MSNRLGQVERITLPFRALSYRLPMVLLVALSTGLLLMGRADAFIFDEARTKAAEISAPLLDLLSSPVAAVREWFSDLDDYLNVYDENQRLRDENARLMEWRDTAMRMEQEAARYEALLNVQPGPGISYLTGRVVAGSGGSFTHTFIVNVGAREGAAKGQAVVDTEGLIGHVVAAGKRSARILLITDINSRIPVRIEASRFRAVMVGDNNGLPKLEFGSDDAIARVGDRVVTSGHGGELPPGLPVGHVVQGSKGALLVKPFAEIARADFVRLLEYKFPKEVDPVEPEEGSDEVGSLTGAVHAASAD